MSEIKTPITLGESVVDEVRAIRQALDEEVDHDIARLASRARQAGEEIRRQYGMKVAQLPPGPVVTPRIGVTATG